MHFSIISGLYNITNLQLNNQDLPYDETIKFLGMIWDRKLTWNTQMTLKTKCTKVMGLLKSMTAQEYGADQTTALKYIQGNN
jgi:hypothetical protein